MRRPPFSLALSLRRLPSVALALLIFCVPPVNTRYLYPVARQKQPSLLVNIPSSVPSSSTAFPDNNFTDRQPTLTADAPDQSRPIRRRDDNPVDPSDDANADLATTSIEPPINNNDGPASRRPRTAPTNPDDAIDSTAPAVSRAPRPGRSSYSSESEATDIEAPPTETENSRPTTSPRIKQPESRPSAPLATLEGVKSSPSLEPVDFIDEIPPRRSPTVNTARTAPSTPEPDESSEGPPIPSKPQRKPGGPTSSVGEIESSPGNAPIGNNSRDSDTSTEAIKASTTPELVESPKRAPKELTLVEPSQPFMGSDDPDTRKPAASLSSDPAPSAFPEQDPTTPEPLVSPGMAIGGVTPNTSSATESTSASLSPRPSTSPQSPSRSPQLDSLPPAEDGTGPTATPDAVQSPQQLEKDPPGGKKIESPEREKISATPEVAESPKQAANVPDGSPPSETPSPAGLRPTPGISISLAPVPTISEKPSVSAQKEVQVAESPIAESVTPSASSISPSLPEIRETPIVRQTPAEGETGVETPNEVDRDEAEPHVSPAGEETEVETPNDAGGDDREPAVTPATPGDGTGTGGSESAAPIASNVPPTVPEVVETPIVDATPVREETEVENPSEVGGEDKDPASTPATPSDGTGTGGSESATPIASTVPSTLPEVVETPIVDATPTEDETEVETPNDAGGEDREPAATPATPSNGTGTGGSESATPVASLVPSALPETVETPIVDATPVREETEVETPSEVGGEDREPAATPATPSDGTGTGGSESAAPIASIVPSALPETMETPIVGATSTEDETEVETPNDAGGEDREPAATPATPSDGTGTGGSESATPVASIVPSAVPETVETPIVDATPTEDETEVETPNDASGEDREPAATPATPSDGTGTGGSESAAPIASTVPSTLPGAVETPIEDATSAGEESEVETPGDDEESNSEPGGTPPNPSGAGGTNGSEGSAPVASSVPSTSSGFMETPTASETPVAEDIATETPKDSTTVSPSTSETPLDTESSSGEDTIDLPFASEDVDKIESVSPASPGAIDSSEVEVPTTDSPVETGSSVPVPTGAVENPPSAVEGSVEGSSGTVTESMIPVISTESASFENNSAPEPSLTPQPSFGEEEQEGRSEEIDDPASQSGSEEPVLGNSPSESSTDVETTEPSEGFPPTATPLMQSTLTMPSDEGVSESPAESDMMSSPGESTSMEIDSTTGGTDDSVPVASTETESAEVSFGPISPGEIENQDAGEESQPSVEGDTDGDAVVPSPLEPSLLPEAPTPVGAAPTVDESETTDDPNTVVLISPDEVSEATVAETGELALETSSSENNVELSPSSAPSEVTPEPGSPEEVPEEDSPATSGEGLSNLSPGTGEATPLTETAEEDLTTPSEDGVDPSSPLVDVASATSAVSISPEISEVPSQTSMPDLEPSTGLEENPSDPPTIEDISSPSPEASAEESIPVASSVVTQEDVRPSSDAQPDDTPSPSGVEDVGETSDPGIAISTSTAPPDVNPSSEIPDRVEPTQPPLPVLSPSSEANTAESSDEGDDGPEAVGGNSSVAPEMFTAEPSQGPELVLGGGTTASPATSAVQSPDNNVVSQPIPDSGDGSEDGDQADSGLEDPSGNSLPGGIAGMSGIAIASFIVMLTVGAVVYKTCAVVPGVGAFGITSLFGSSDDDNEKSGYTSEGEERDLDDDSPWDQVWKSASELPEMVVAAGEAVAAKVGGQFAGLFKPGAARVRPPQVITRLAVPGMCMALSQLPGSDMMASASANSSELRSFKSSRFPSSHEATSGTKSGSTSENGAGSLKTGRLDGPKVDLLFVFDASGSLSWREYRQMKEVLTKPGGLLDDLMSKTHSGSRVGFVEYAYDSVVVSELDRDEEAVRRRILSSFQGDANNWDRDGMYIYEVGEEVGGNALRKVDSLVGRSSDNILEADQSRDVLESEGDVEEPPTVQAKEVPPAMNGMSREVHLALKWSRFEMLPPVVNKHIQAQVQKAGRLRRVVVINAGEFTKGGQSPGGVEAAVHEKQKMEKAGIRILTVGVGESCEVNLARVATGKSHLSATSVSGVIPLLPKLADMILKADPRQDGLLALNPPAILKRRRRKREKSLREKRQHAVYRAMQAGAIDPAKSISKGLPRRASEMPPWFTQ